MNVSNGVFACVILILLINFVTLIKIVVMNARLSPSVFNFSYASFGYLFGIMFNVYQHLISFAFYYRLLWTCAGSLKNSYFTR